MEIQVRQTGAAICRELARQTKTAHITMESVVPDTRDDIGRILSVRPEIYLKSKELHGRSATVGGEAAATVLYCNELQNAVDCLRLSQPFSIEYELPEAEESCQIQARFLPCAAQGRVLNPRKLALDLELGCRLTLTGGAELCVSQSLPEPLPAPIHTLEETTTLTVLTGVCEKSLTLSEQLPWPETLDAPAEIIGRELSFTVRDRETVGSRLLVKGEARLLLLLRPENAAVPREERFTLPFSQLLELGESGAEAAELWVEPGSVYVETVETVDGKRLLDLELHALVQARTRRALRVQSIADAYCNAMPCHAETETLRLTGTVTERTLSYSAEERQELPGEELEILAWYPSLGACTGAQAGLSLDLLGRTGAGNLVCLRRSLTLRPQETCEEDTPAFLRVTQTDCRSEGGELLLSARAEGERLEKEPVELRRLTALSLDEESLFDSAAYPSLTAVWAETESVWELAKLYHSAPESIRALNEDLSDRPLFIPKCD